MSQAFKIKTPFPGLCSSCANSTILQYRSGKAQVSCSWFGRITGPVDTCTEYRAANQPSVKEFESIGWIIDTSPRRIGFIRPGTADHKAALERKATPDPFDE